MIIIGNEYYINADYPNSKFIEGDLIDDNSKLATKVLELYPYFKLVKNNDEIVDVVKDIQRENKDKIAELKKNLSDTDYQAIKYSEGQILDGDYAPIKEQRQTWRDEINRLEAILSESNNQ